MKPSFHDPCDPDSGQFDFARQGIAHIGMEPDFFQAIADTTLPGGEPDGKAAAMNIYDSAEAFVDMWDKIEAARGGVQLSGSLMCPSG